MAAVAASVGDLVMLVVANAAHFGLALPLPYTLLGIGAALGVGFIPVYAIGYFAAARALFASSPRAGGVVRACGAAAAAVGAIIHAVTAGLILAGLQAGPADAAPADPLAAVARVPALVAMWSVAAVLLCAACAPLLWRGVRGPEKWALANPLVATLAIAALGGAFELGRFFVVPAAPNLAHVVFFAIAARSSARG